MSHAERLSSTATARRPILRLSVSHATSSASAVDPTPLASEAADDQLHILLEQTPRGLNGIISHRVVELQLWADQSYMAAPLIACALIECPSLLIGQMPA